MRSLSFSPGIGVDIFNITVSLAFVTAGVFMLRAPDGVVLGAITITFFGLGVIVFTKRLITDRPTPLLQITEIGLTSHYSRFMLPIIGWEDIRALAIYQKPWPRQSNTPVYYLAMIARDPQALRDLEDEGVEWPMASLPPMLPYEARIGAIVPLNELFSTTKPDAIRARTLDRIQAMFDSEITQYGVEIDRVIHDV
jgi:hypothetical protein